jgi:hypothetical protein
MGVFATIMTEPAAQAQDTGPGYRDRDDRRERACATGPGMPGKHAKAHRTASSLAVQKGGADG